MGNNQHCLKKLSNCKLLLIIEKFGLLTVAMVISVKIGKRTLETDRVKTVSRPEHLKARQAQVNEHTKQYPWLVLWWVRAVMSTSCDVCLQRSLVGLLRLLGRGWVESAWHNYCTEAKKFNYSKFWEAKWPLRERREWNVWMPSVQEREKQSFRSMNIDFCSTSSLEYSRAYVYS